MTGWSLNKILLNIYFFYLIGKLDDIYIIIRLNNVYTLSDSVNYPMKGKHSQNSKRMWLEPVLVIKYRDLKSNPLSTRPHSRVGIESKTIITGAISSM